MKKTSQIPPTQTSFLAADPVVFYDGQYLQELPEIPLDLPVLAFDVETNTHYDGIGPKKNFGLSYVADVTVISLAWGDHRLAYSYDALNIILLHVILSAKTLVAHNAVFDMRQLSKYGVHHTHIWDTLTMARLLRPELERYERFRGKTRKGYSLLECLDMWNIPYPEYMKAQKVKRGKLHQQTRESVLAYAADDAGLTLQLYHKQRATEVVQESYELCEWEIKAVTEYCRMAGNGLGLNLEFAHNKIKQLKVICDSKQFGFNARSAPERVCFIYGVPALPKKYQDNPKRVASHAKKCAEWQGRSLNLTKPDFEPYSVFFTSRGGLSTSGDALRAMASEWGLSTKQKEILLDLADFVTCHTMIGTIQSYINHAAIDNHVHSMINIATVTGRRNSSNPNLQNIKLAGSPDDIEGNLCGLFKPLDPDFTYVELDYNNAENRMQGMLAGDSVMIAACLAGDFHAAMAAVYFGDEFTSLEPHSPEWNYWRDQGKKITFGNAYGMGAEKLSISLGISQGKAQEILSTKKAAFYQITKAQQIAASRIARDGYIKLWTGRKVPVRKDKAYKAWNAVSQGGVGEMLKRAIVLIGEEYRSHGMDSYIAHDMHDALILAVHKDEWIVAIQIASDIMQNIIPEDLNHRTDPPCEWVAQPDLKKNAKKWGAGQYHPEQPKEKRIKPKTAVKTDLVTGQKTYFGYSMPELNFDQHCYPQIGLIQALLNNANQTIDNARSQVYKIPIWRADTGDINHQDIQEFDLANLVKVLKVYDSIRVAKLWTVEYLDKELGINTRAIQALPAKLDEYETQVINMIGAIAKNGKA